MKIVGFLANSLCLRGVPVALFDYAYHNQSLLGNKSIIISRKNGEKTAIEKFAKHFAIFLFETLDELDNIVETQGISHLYIAKYGHNDGIMSSKCKNIIHCIFSTAEPHGDIYVPLGQTINCLFNTNITPFPHIIMPPLSNCGTMRPELGIPNDAIVFGRHGGADTFDIPIYDVINFVVHTNPNIYFLFMNTNKFAEHKQIIYLDGTYCLNTKQRFINTCDAMIHARARGETFGLACAEFDINNKPVITYELSPENEHLRILGERALTYKTKDELAKLLLNFNNVERLTLDTIGYAKFTPQYVMQMFNKFLE